MDNTQCIGWDGSWFLFGDWCGVTRISLPGDKVKTNTNLDRPNETKPFVLRANGMLWFEYAVDIDPVALKKVRPPEPGHSSPDPLDGPELVVNWDGGAVTVRDQELKFVPTGEELQLGGVEDHRLQFVQTSFNVFPDGALAIFGAVDKKPIVTFIEREPDGAGRVAWCRPIARLPHGDPDVFRSEGAVFLADHDIVHDVAWLTEVGAGGAVSTTQAPAIAGPWVHDGQVWWQPDERTLCAGARLDEAIHRFELGAEHAGPGRMLRLPGRKLFLPWHGVTMLDLAPAKKGKGEIARKIKAAEVPMYQRAQALFLPIRNAMAKRGVRVAWRGVVRSGKSITPKFELQGKSDLLTYLLAYGLRDGARTVLASHGATSVDGVGGTSFDDVFKPAALTTADDLLQLVSMLDAAGLPRAPGFGYLTSLAESAAQRNLGLAWTQDVEALALAITLSGLRGETSGDIPPATPASLAEIAPKLRDAHLFDGGVFLAVAGHRRFGAGAVAPIISALEELNPRYPETVQRALGWPVTK